MDRLGGATLTLPTLRVGPLPLPRCGRGQHRRSRHLGALMALDPVLLSRIQFGFLVSFHIILPAYTIGLAAWHATIAGMRLATGNRVYILRQPGGAVLAPHDPL